MTDSLLSRLERARDVYRKLQAESQWPDIVAEETADLLDEAIGEIKAALGN